MSRCDLCTDSCEAYRLEALPPLLRTKHVAHICPSCSAWVEGVHQRMVSTLAPRMRSAIAQRKGLEPRTPWWRRIIELFHPPAHLSLTEAEREQISNVPASMICEYGSHTVDARTLLKQQKQITPSPHATQAAETPQHTVAKQMKIESDGTAAGTRLLVDGKELGNVERIEIHPIEYGSPVRASATFSPVELQMDADVELFPSKGT